MSEKLREALEYAAEHLSSDWPERCQQIVRRARAALSTPAQAQPKALTTVELDNMLASVAHTLTPNGYVIDTEMLRKLLLADRASRLPAVTECNDNDSPWLVCKTCAARGLCAKSLPEMGEGDWPELPEPDGVHERVVGIDAQSGGDVIETEDAWSEQLVRAAQVAAVEAYKALARGKT